MSWKLKSVMDRLGAFLLLVAVAPLMAVIALAVRLDSPGPVFFRQPRFGAGRSVIVVTKFRTMRPEGTDIGGRRQATRGRRPRHPHRPLPAQDLPRRAAAESGTCSAAA